MSHPKSTILLVDDEECLRQLLARTLEDAGFVVVEAENGAAALQCARRLNGALGLVVTDIMMPVMDGLEFARALRMMNTKVPLLFITGSCDPALFPDVRLRGELLTKPFAPDELLAVVARLVPGVMSPGQLA
jgi:two-component system, OmpR family, response regulator VicR